MHKDIRTRSRAYLTQFSIPALLKPMINKMADEASAILLLICSHEVWVKVTYDWSTTLCLCLCICRFLSQSCDIIKSTNTRRTTLSIFLVLMLMSTQFSLAYTCACAYTYAYALVKTRLFFLKRNGLSIYKLPPADRCQVFLYSKVMRLLKNEKEFHPPPHDDTDKKIFGAWLMR